MKLQEVGLILLLMAVGTITGFVAWTYVGPKLSGLTHQALPSA